MVTSGSMRGRWKRRMVDSLTASITAGRDFPGNDYPYVPPSSSDRRSPCPGMNTLANHGFLPRNGTDIPLDLVRSLLPIVFGFGADSTSFLLDRTLSRGLNLTLNEFGEEVFQFEELNQHNIFEHDGSFVRVDHFFDPEKRFSEKLFSDLASTSSIPGHVTQADIAKHQDQRIIHSRTQNPEHSFFHYGPEGYVTWVGEATMLFLFGDDYNLTSIPISNLRSFLEFNKFPDGFKPIRPFLNLTTPQVQKALNFFSMNVLSAMTGDLPTTLPTNKVTPFQTPTVSPSKKTPGSPTEAPTVHISPKKETKNIWTNPTAFAVILTILIIITLSLVTFLFVHKKTLSV